MSFDQAISGLNAAQTNLDLIGNNVANANTVGYKSATAEFSDVYAATISNQGLVQTGIGVAINHTSTDYSQGAITVTNNPLDIAINGEGFFQLSRSGAQVYSRSGTFQVNSSGFLSNANGDLVEGYGVDSTGAIQQFPTPNPISISLADISPQQTGKIALVANLNSNSKPLNVANFNPTDTSTYTSSTSTQVFDSLGHSHTLSLFFIDNNAALNSWDARAQLDGVSVNSGNSIGKLNFASDGTINTSTSTFPATISLNIPGGATTPQSVKLDVTGTTQYSSAFGVTQVTQDGYQAGSLTGLSITAAGIISGTYSNGLTRAQGQISLASFTNKQGLQAESGNAWSQTQASGVPVVGAPQSGTLGSLQSGSLEQSNVDLTTALVNMITAQYDYQANSQTIKTENAIMQTLTQMG